MAIPTEERSRRRGVGAFLREHIGFAMLSAGSPLGAEMWKPHYGRPQTCAKESKVEAALQPLWILFFGFVAEYLLAKHRNNRYSRTAATTPRNTRVHGETRPAPIYGRTGRAV